MTFAAAKTVLNVMNDAALYTCFVPAQYAIIIIPFQSGKIKKNEWNCGCRRERVQECFGNKKRAARIDFGLCVRPQKWFDCYLPVVTFR